MFDIYKQKDMAKARKEGKGSRNRRNLKKRLELIKKNVELLQKYGKELN